MFGSNGVKAYQRRSIDQPRRTLEASVSIMLHYIPWLMSYEQDNSDMEQSLTAVSEINFVQVNRVYCYSVVEERSNVSSINLFFQIKSSLNVTTVLRMYAPCFVSQVWNITASLR